MVPSSKEPDLALAGLALLIVFGLMIWHDQPIKSDRPAEPIHKQIQDRKIEGNSYESRPWEDPFGFDPGAYLQKTPTNFRCFRLAKEINNKSVKVLVSVVKVHPNTLDHRESRIRQRSAVMAGLTESGYLPSEPNRLYFYSSCLNGDDEEFDIRLEYYKKPEDNKSDTLVIWIDNRTKAKCPKGNSANENCLSLSQLIKNGLNKNFNTKALADKLANKLTDEIFAQRRITKASEIAIITEQDTKSIRDLSSLFCQSFSQKSTGNSDCSKIKNITYQKGLDAYQQTIDTQNQKKNDRSAKKWNDRLSIIDQHNPPIGSARFDYLHRLAVEIKNTHNKPDPKQRIKAVGVFGSDFYDKLLIFQALRREMPNIVLFTTDLDAQMFYPEHWRWTRNLIVASHFDLKLKETYQTQSPPFRDSQQTALYYATLIAAGNHKLAEKVAKKEVSPLIFEIGRNGPVPLNVSEMKKGCEESESNSNSSVHPCYDDSKQLKTILILLIVITLVLIFLLGEIQPNSGNLFIWLIVTAFVFYWAWYSALDEANAPFNLTDGISLWPTVLIRIIVCLLATLFFFKSVEILEANFHRLNRRYFGGNNNLRTLCTDEAPFSFKEIIHSLMKHSDKPAEIDDTGWFLRWLAAIFILKSVILYWPHAISPDAGADFFIQIAILLFWLWLFSLPSGFINYCQLAKKIFSQPLIIFPFFIVIAFIFIPFTFIALSDLPEETKIITGLFFLILFLFSIITLIDPNFKSIKSWAEGNTSNKIISFDSLWEEYHAHGRFRQRVARMTAMWLFFVTMAAILDSLLPILTPIWPSPCRGASCDWDVYVQTISFIVIMLLILFVLDALRLCFYWIQKLRTKHALLINPSSGKHDKRRKLKLLEEIVILVAKRTHVVDRLIYYPLIAMMLMLFARINYFDNLDFPLAMGITFATSIILLFFAGFKLRSEAERLRITVINCAEKLAKNSSANDANTTIEEIRNINYGAFYPMLEQPVMRGLLLILASLGLFAGEYIMIFG